jgi:SAM-dependent methyltransferase
MSSTVNDDVLRRRAFEEGSVWVTAPYYDEAEGAMANCWNQFIWPLIQDCDFSRVVDLAAGHGRNGPFLRAVSGQVIIVDINKENVDFCRRRFAGDPKFRFLQNDGCGLAGLADGSVSLIYCFDAMVHFDSDVIRKYLQDFYRVLQPGGRGFCHHSNYPGNPAGDFREDYSWRNFMSQELFHHYCAKEGLSVVRSQVLEWAETPRHDCLTVFEKPLSPAWKQRVQVRVWPSPGLTPVRRHLTAELLSAGSVQGAPTPAPLCRNPWDPVVIQPPPSGDGGATVVALDVTTWGTFGTEVEWARAEVAALGTPSSGPIVCRLELRSGERGGGALLRQAEITLSSTDGWSKLEVSCPSAGPVRSLLLVARAAESARSGPLSQAAFRDLQIGTAPVAR